MQPDGVYVGRKTTNKRTVLIISFCATANNVHYECVIVTVDFINKAMNIIQCRPVQTAGSVLEGF